jgi:hypothetical protein
MIPCVLPSVLGGSLLLVASVVTLIVVSLVRECGSRRIGQLEPFFFIEEKPQKGQKTVPKSDFVHIASEASRGHK